MSNRGNLHYSAPEKMHRSERIALPPRDQESSSSKRNPPNNSGLSSTSQPPPDETAFLCQAADHHAHQDERAPASTAQGHTEGGASRAQHQQRRTRTPSTPSRKRRPTSRGGSCSSSPDRGAAPPPSRRNSPNHGAPALSAVGGGSSPGGPAAPVGAAAVDVYVESTARAQHRNKFCSAEYWDDRFRLIVDSSRVMRPLAYQQEQNYSWYDRGVTNSSSPMRATVSGGFRGRLSTTTPRNARGKGLSASGSPVNLARQRRREAVVGGPAPPRMNTTSPLGFGLKRGVLAPPPASAGAVPDLLQPLTTTQLSGVGAAPGRTEAGRGTCAPKDGPPKMSNAVIRSCVEDKTSATPTVDVRSDTPSYQLPTQSSLFGTKALPTSLVPRFEEFYNFRWWNVAPILRQWLRPSDKILHVGCGLSQFGPDMAADGYRYVSNSGTRK